MHGTMTGTLTWSIPINGISTRKVAQLNDAVTAAFRTVLGPTAVSTSTTRTDAEEAVVSGWTRTLLAEFIQRLRADGAEAQADTILAAVRDGGVISRADAYEVAGWDPDERSLKGFTRPVNRVLSEMKKEGRLPDDAPRPLTPVYNENKRGYQRAVSFSVPNDLLPLFSTD